MIIKNKDNKQDSIDYLSDLLDRDFSDQVKGQIDREIKSLQPGDADEVSLTYILNNKFRDSRNWMLIHDLSLESDGQTIKIDHLLINRMMDFYLIESKSFTHDVLIDEEGGFSYFYNNKPYSMKSPIIKNKQNIACIKEYLESNNLLPKRLGITIEPSFRDFVLVSTDSALEKPVKGLYDCSSVMSVDKFIDRFKDVDTKDYDDIADLAKVVSQDNLQRMAEKLVLNHKPTAVDYVNKFSLKGSTDINDVDSDNDLNQPVCPVCGSGMVKREAKKGKNAGKAFYGCSKFPKCRGVLELDDITKERPKEDLKDQSPSCPKCKGSMVRRVSKKGKNAGQEFWGCEDFPNCRGVVSINKNT